MKKLLFIPFFIISNIGLSQSEYDAQDQSLPKDKNVTVLVNKIVDRQKIIFQYSRDKKSWFKTVLFPNENKTFWNTTYIKLFTKNENEFISKVFLLKPAQKYFIDWNNNEKLWYVFQFED